MRGSRRNKILGGSLYTPFKPSWTCRGKGAKAFVPFFQRGKPSIRQGQGHGQAGGRGEARNSAGALALPTPEAHIGQVDSPSISSEADTHSD